MKHLILLVINGVSERWGRCRWGLCACLLAGLLVMGCTKQEIIYRPTQQSVSMYSFIVSMLESIDVNFCKELSCAI